MKHLQSILSDFLDKTGGKSPIVLGKHEENLQAQVISERDKEYLIQKLEEAARKGDTMVLTMTVMLITLFLVGLLFAFYYRDSPTTLGVIFGGTFLSLTTIFLELKRLWREKTAFDMLIGLLPSMSVSEAMKAVRSVYYLNLLEKKHRSKTVLPTQEGTT